MPAINRLDEMVALVLKRGFMSVRELSELFGVSEVTIWRDLQRLHDEQRLLRTYGGAAPLSLQPARQPRSVVTGPDGASADSSLIEQVDVLIAISWSSRSDAILLERAEKHAVPIVAELLALPGAKTLIAVDNHEAGRSLGRWAGQYVTQHFAGSARVLDLSYHLSNTQERSSGFAAGLRETASDAQIALSLNTQADWRSAYQLTTDALQVYPEINVVFGVNDTIVSGAIEACRDLGIAPESLLVLTFGLEGKTLLDELCKDDYLKAGLAMFPEIVGPTCVEAAIAAFNGVELPAQLVTPHMVLTAQSLREVYEPAETGWQLKPSDPRVLDALLSRFSGRTTRATDCLPGSASWCRSASTSGIKILRPRCRAYSGSLGIDLDIADAAENMKEELVLRKLSIAGEASQLVSAGDVVLIDGGETTSYLAEALIGRRDITVITNSMDVFETLRSEPGIALISTGGLLRQESQTLTGPTTEIVLRELRADRLFLAVSGVSLDFGLSHTNLAEVTVKQAMIRAAARGDPAGRPHPLRARVGRPGRPYQRRPQDHHRQRLAGQRAAGRRQTGHRDRAGEDLNSALHPPQEHLISAPVSQYLSIEEFACSHANERTSPATCRGLPTLFQPPGGRPRQLQGLLHAAYPGSGRKAPGAGVSKPRPGSLPVLFSMLLRSSWLPEFGAECILWSV